MGAADHVRAGCRRADLPSQPSVGAAGPLAVSVRSMDIKLEVVGVPVTDVDRAKAFYVDQVGFIADHDQVVSDEIRFVQLTRRARPARSPSAKVFRRWNRVHCKG